MKTIGLYISILIMSLFSFNVMSELSHLELAIQNTEIAIASLSKNNLIEHASAAMAHANSARKDINPAEDGTHLSAGIDSLDDAIREAKIGNINAAKYGAEEALKYFRQVSK